MDKGVKQYGLGGKKAPMGGLEITNDVTRNSKALRGNALGGA